MLERVRNIRVKQIYHLHQQQSNTIMLDPIRRFFSLFFLIKLMKTAMQPHFLLLKSFERIFYVWVELHIMSALRCKTSPLKRFVTSAAPSR